MRARSPLRLTLTMPVSPESPNLSDTRKHHSLWFDAAAHEVSSAWVSRRSEQVQLVGLVEKLHRSLKIPGAQFLDLNLDIDRLKPLLERAHASSARARARAPRRTFWCALF